MKIRLKHILIICLFFCIVNNPTKATSIDFYSYLTIEVKQNIGAGIYTDNAGNPNQETSLNIQHEITISAEKIQTEFLRIYPNPIIDIMQIDYTPKINLSIYDLRGREVLNTDEKVINLSMLSTGIYILIVQDKIDGYIARSLIHKL